MKRYPFYCLLALALLAGCDNDTPVIPEAKVIEAPAKPLTVEERIAAKNAQHWDDGRVYITENNYVIYDEATGKPEHFIVATKEWPREDLNNAESYDLPRLVFRWDNGRNIAKEHYDQRDKVWSIKTDGTDLRVVADEFVGMVRLMRISPNNRYLALAYSAEEGMFKVIKDLKTGEYTELGRSRGYPEFLWAEDSSYLYYVDKFENWKYTLNTGDKEQVETKFNEYSVIHGGKRFVVSGLGVGVYDEITDKKLYNVVPDKLSDVESALFRKRGISPTGRYAWAQTRTRRYLIDVENKTFQSEKIDPSKVGQFEKLAIISKKGNFARSAGGALVFLFELNEKQQISNYIKWKQIGTGHSAYGSSLYNAFANDGDFVKGGAQ